MASSDSFGLALLVTAILAFVTNSASISVKLCKEFSTPKLWKLSLLHQDAAYLALSTGLTLIGVYLQDEHAPLCRASEFFLIFGLIQCSLSFVNTGIILLSFQNPGKPSSVSGFHRNVAIALVTPGVVLSAIIATLPYVSADLFDSGLGYDVTCLPVRDKEKNGSTYGLLIIALLWILSAITLTCDIILVLKLWKFNNRINSAQNNVWQTQLLLQGKLLVKFSAVDHVVLVIVLVVTTVGIYSSEVTLSEKGTWIVLTALAADGLIHGLLSNVNNVMWTTCCCRDTGAVKEPHRKLKKLELIQIEAPGKLRMKATWTVGKNASKRGMMKVYGVNHLKSWAQEIVMLGMLRKTQHPSLIQCLWTNSSNPYYETMTLISGEIITSDSRIICLELTNGGTLHDFLQKAELPLPEPCQRMIVHDVAEGLFYLHHENILHNNLTSSCIYLKGSLQSMVLRAAVGDFEDAEIYGTLQQSIDNSIKDKRYFFLPDIRSFALIALEIVSTMCEKKFQNRYVHYNAEHVPMKLNLATVISDEDDEFEAQYCYEVEETHRMFDEIHHKEHKHYDERCFSPDFSQGNRTDSLDNLMDKNRPTSGIVTRERKRDSFINYEQMSGDTDEEVAAFNARVAKQSNARRPMSPGLSPKRCKSPEMVQSSEIRSTRKSRRDVGKSAERVILKATVKKPHSRSLSPRHYMIESEDKTSSKGRCLSPDPMQDERLRELRNETKGKPKKERKLSFKRKKSEEKLKGLPNGQAPKVVEAFVKSGNGGKSKDSWKPSSILKSITSSDTTVSVFKAKPNEEDSMLDAIQEEEISNVHIDRHRARNGGQDDQKQKAEVWDIIDEQYYTQVNKRAMKNLRKTISGESRSSLWSFISTQEDLDDEDDDALAGILECLPGMADSPNLRKPEITVSDIMKERDNAQDKREAVKRFSYTDLSKSKFELIDYYEMLKRRQITMQDVPEDKREMLLNVVELKREERIKRESKSNGAIRSDELYDNGMSPNGSTMNLAKGGKIKVVSFRKNHLNTNQQPCLQVQHSEMDPRLERARSAPLKRPRTPMHKPAQTRPEMNPAFVENNSLNLTKRTRARSALKRALNNKTKQNMRQSVDRTPVGEKEDIALKYASVRTISVASVGNQNESEDSYRAEEHENASIPNGPSKNITVKRYSSFSSNESAVSSVVSTGMPKPADMSLTSGEISSLSSQAESEHYETDGHITDADGPLRPVPVLKRKLSKASSSRIDSGFDSGSMSSEMSESLYNKNKSQIGQQQKNSGVINSWARNYKMVDPVSHSPYAFASKFLPPVSSLPEESTANEHVEDAGFENYAYESDNGVNLTGDIRDSKPDLRSVAFSSAMINTGLSKGLGHTSRPLSPNRPISPKRPLSAGRPMSPSVRPMSPGSRQLSPRTRPMSPKYRPITPNVQPTDNRPLNKLRLAKGNRPMSPLSRDIKSKAFANAQSPSPRPFSPVSSKGPPSHAILNDVQEQRPISPFDQQKRVQSPIIKVEATGIGGEVSKATKRYRELVKHGVPMRASVIDASPTRESGNKQDEISSRPCTADSMIEEPMDDHELYADLDAKGFFAHRSRSPSPFKNGSPSRCKSPSNSGKVRQSKEQRRKKSKEVPLDQIVREKPDGEYKAPRAHRSASHNHLTVSEDAFLNQPTSEDSEETCSIKTTKSNTSMSPGTKHPKMVVDAELVIDRIFSQNNNNPNAYELDVEVEAALGLDKDPFKTLKKMYPSTGKDDVLNLDNVPRLDGVTQKHIHECLELATHLHVITVRDVLPATSASFETLRTKLQQVGQLGTVGNQLLDIIRKCWLHDMPPTSGDLVEQLTDPVTETEV